MGISKKGGFVSKTTEIAGYTLDSCWKYGILDSKFPAAGLPDIFSLEEVG